MTNLLLVRPTRLHRTLRIANLLQNTPTILQTLRIQILLLRDLRQQHAQLVANIAHGLILCALAPLAQLAGDRSGFFGGGLIGADGVVLRLDQTVEALGELGLLDSAQGGEGEMVFAAAAGLGCAACVAAFGADGVGTADIPGGDESWYGMAWRGWSGGCSRIGASLSSFTYMVAVVFQLDRGSLLSSCTVWSESQSYDLEK